MAPSVTRMDEAIKVRADFMGGMITPIRLKRKDQVFRVCSVNGRWIDREGRYPRYCFSISVPDGTVMQLTLRTQDMVWKLDSITLNP